MMVDAIRARLRARAIQDLPPDNLILRTDRPNASVGQRQSVVSGVFNLGPGLPCPLYAWVLRREQAYFDGPGVEWSHEEITYAACRDYDVWTRRTR